MTTQIQVTESVGRTDPRRRDEILAEPGFGRHHTDHMVRSAWNESDGWHSTALVPYGPLTLDPATSGLHYGQAVFEGLKAYRHADDSVWAFRPDRNAARFAASARRLAMPQMPSELFLAAVDTLVSVDRDWVVGGRENSLYLRPLMFATEIGLGVRPSNSYDFVLFASPAGAYFPNGIEPVSVWICDDYVRAAPGGTGEAKCAGNYAASLVAQAEAAAHGCDQVVWLDAQERTYVEEMGAMNLFFVVGTGQEAVLITPELSGSLLPGITRDSIIVLASDLGIRVRQEAVSVEQWREGCASGSISEVFACGTAAVVTPVGSVKSRAKGSWSVSGGATGAITLQLRTALLDIQNGSVPDRHGWMHRIR